MGKTSMTPEQVSMETIKAVGKIFRESKDSSAFDLDVPVCVFRALREAFKDNVFETPEAVIGGDDYTIMTIVIAKDREAFEEHENGR